MLNIKEYLHRIDIFKDRDESTLDFLALSAGVRSYIKNEHIFIDREEVSNFYFVIRGKAALYKLNSRHEKKVIFIYGSGAFLNEVMIQDKFASINCELLNEIGENVKNLTATSILFGNLFKAEYIKEISISDCTLTIKTIIESSNEQKRKVENEIVTIPLNKIQNIEVVNDKQESGQIKKNIFNKKTLKNFLRVFCCMIFEKLFSVKVFICIRSYFFTFFRFFFISFSLRLTFFDRF